MWSLLKDDRGIFAPAARRFRTNLDGVISGRLQFFKGRRKIGRLNHSRICGIVVPRVTPHCKPKVRFKCQGQSQSLFAPLRSKHACRNSTIISFPRQIYLQKDARLVNLI